MLCIVVDRDSLAELAVEDVVFDRCERPPEESWFLVFAHNITYV